MKSNSRCVLHSERLRSRYPTTTHHVRVLSHPNDSNAHNVSDIMKIRETARIAKAAKVEAAFGSWPAESLTQAAKVVELAVGL